MDINQPFRRWRRISQRPPLSIFSLQDLVFFYLILFWTLRRERERDREKQWLVLLSCSLRVHLVHSDHVFQTREKFVGQDSSSSAYSNIPLFLTSFYTHYFHFLIIHLLLGLGLCVRATLAFRTHWSRGHQGHELSFSFFFLVFV